MPTGCPNGYRPDGSTTSNDRNTTNESDDSTPNTDSADDDQPRPPEGDVDTGSRTRSAFDTANPNAEIKERTD
jgi:hypothetical protein